MARLAMLATVESERKIEKGEHHVTFCEKTQYNYIDARQGQNLSDSVGLHQIQPL